MLALQRVRRSGRAGDKLRYRTVSFVLAVLLVGCAAPQRGPEVPSGQIASPRAQPVPPKKILLGLQAELTVLSETARQGGPSGSAILHEFLNAGPAMIDDQGLPRPQLAETVPTTENGLWKL